MTVRLGLVGYGFGGRYFHAPYVAAAEGIEIAGVVARSPERVAEVEADLPGVPVYPSLTDLLAAGVDVVTVSTPPWTRRELVLEAVAAGTAVVADKPFAPSAEAGRELVAAAADAGVPLTVFHNRRWDADIRTVHRLLAEGRVGEVWSVESRFELDDPATLEGGPDGGLLRDMGAHLVDQMVTLLGPVGTVQAYLDDVDTDRGRTDGFFSVTMRHTSGVRSTITSGKLNHLIGRELRVYGSAGSYVASGTDVQTQAVLAGRRPADEGAAWGYEDESRWGVLRTAAGAERVPSERGAYQDFYSGVAAALRGDGPMPVDVDGAVHVLEVLDAARESARTGGTVAVERVPVRP